MGFRMPQYLPGPSPRAAGPSGLLLRKGFWTADNGMICRNARRT